MDREPALAIVGPRQVQTSTYEPVEPSPSEVAIRPQYVGICGTDLDLFTGTSPYLHDGQATYPLQFGHEWVGLVVAAGSAEYERLVGSRVTSQPIRACGHCETCRRGHGNVCPRRDEMGVRGKVPGAACRWMCAPVDTLCSVPPDVDSQFAVVAEPAVTVLHAYERSGLRPGERLAVIGVGTLGLIAVQVASAMGCRVVALDVDDAALVAAQQSGASAVLRADRDVRVDEHFDVVLESSGAPAAERLIATLSSEGTRVAVVGIQSGEASSFDLSRLVTLGVSVFGVLGGPHLLDRALQLIAANVIRPHLLIDRVYAAGQASEAFDHAAKRGRPRPKVLLEMIWAHGPAN